MIRILLISALLLFSTMTILTSAAPMVNTVPSTSPPLSAITTNHFFNSTIPHDKLTLRAPYDKYVGLGKEGWLQSVRNLNVASEPFCFKTTDTKMCTAATRPYEDQKTPELFLYDHNCERFQHWIGEPYPNTGHGITSKLPYVVMIWQQNGEISPSVEYAGSTWDKATCVNGGPSAHSPGFRLACWVQFDCSAPKQN